MVAVLGVGHFAGHLFTALRLPRVVGMIFAGIALAPALSPGVVTACSAGVPHAYAPASVARTLALLLALARGAFGLDFRGVARLRGTAAALSILPFLAEWVIEAAAARAVLPMDSGIAGVTRVAFLAASLWAALSPSLVIPNMLQLVEEAGQSASRCPVEPSNLVLCAAPLEVALALVSYGAVSSGIKSSVSGAPVTTLLLVPVWLGLSVALGASLAAVLAAWRRLRVHSLVASALGGDATPAEQLTAFVAAYMLSYTLCQDYMLPNLIGTVSALAYAFAVRWLCPDLARLAAPQLKTAWSFAEIFLFVFTGVVVRGAIDSRSDAFSLTFLCVLLLGNAARLLADVVVALIWRHETEVQAATAVIKAGDEDLAVLLVDGSVAGEFASREMSMTPANVQVAHIPFWRDIASRAGFLWASTTPKATVQAALGGAPLAAAVALGIDATTGAFIQQSAAISILYCATVGSLLTHSLGRYLLATSFTMPAGKLPSGGISENADNGGTTTAHVET